MKLQLALDSTDIEMAKEVLSEVQDIIDIAEIGTPLIIKEGVGAVREIKEQFPSLVLLADLKIVDGGKYESEMAFGAGADIVTVLGVADDMTVQAVIRSAREWGKAVMVDMLCVLDTGERAGEIDGMQADYICVHTAFDLQTISAPPLHELKTVKTVVTNARIAIAGGINEQTIVDILDERPDIVVVGSAITLSNNPGETTLLLKNMINQKKGEL
jgi:3-hexulose-6-phosphate synthase